MAAVCSASCCCGAGKIAYLSTVGMGEQLNLPLLQRCSPLLAYRPPNPRHRHSIRMCCALDSINTQTAPSLRHNSCALDFAPNISPSTSRRPPLLHSDTHFADNPAVLFVSFESAALSRETRIGEALTQSWLPPPISRARTYLLPVMRAMVGQPRTKQQRHVSAVPCN